MDAARIHAARQQHMPSRTASQHPQQLRVGYGSNANTAELRVDLRFHLESGLKFAESISPVSAISNLQPGFANRYLARETGANPAGLNKWPPQLMINP